MLRLVKHFYVKGLVTDAELIRIDSYLKLHTNFHKCNHSFLSMMLIDYKVPTYRDQCIEYFEGLANKNANINSGITYEDMHMSIF